MILSAGAAGPCLSLLCLGQCQVETWSEPQAYSYFCPLVHHRCLCSAINQEKNMLILRWSPFFGVLFLPALLIWQIIAGHYDASCLKLINTIKVL